jgi:hypothetical protein
MAATAGKSWSEYTSSSVSKAGTAAYEWQKNFFGESMLGPIAAIALPFVLNVGALQAVANKDSVNNYTIVWLIFGASYLIGITGYLLIMTAGMTSEQQMYLLLFLVMVCFTLTVASGGVATLAMDALSTATNSVSSK